MSIVSERPIQCMTMVWKMRWKRENIINATTINHFTVKAALILQSTLNYDTNECFCVTLLPRCMECRRGLAMRILSVCLSVRLSVCLTRDLWQTKQSCVRIFIPHKRPFILVLWLEEWLVGPSASTWNLGQPAPLGAKWPILNRYSIVAPQT